MAEVKTCPKCNGTMVRDSEDVFGNVSKRSRNLKYRAKSQDSAIQTYYCENCGYMEFYKEKKEHARIEETERKQSERRKSLVRKEGQPPSVPSRERSYV